MNIVQEKFSLHDDYIETPSTESVKYIGSKLKLIPYILELLKKTGAKSIFDGFSGSTRVSQAFAKKGYRVVANDISEWSEIFGTCYLKNYKAPREYQSLIDHLNSLPPEDGWFTENYGGDIRINGDGNAIQSDGTKKPWQKKNTRKLDAIRKEIDVLNLDKISKSVVLTSLILALDEVDSTLGHYVSYLKDWSPRSFKDSRLKVPKLWENKTKNTVLRGDVFESLSSMNVDLAYYDPPYGSNNEKMPPSRVRYASYYHLWTTICRNDKPSLFGKASRREDTSDKISISVFEEFRRNTFGKFIAVDAIERLIQKTSCEWILLSYSSGGRATAKELNEVINDNGKLVDTLAIEHKRNVMATMKWTNKWLQKIENTNKEFLFLIKK